ncbi:hypothetical protein [Pseudarthrobacter sp. N5]|uniref:hypothetical protein n=1 Tax=Pseudarthrobacter sp. N5 TaxID=3418416 RepID=UPI003CECE31A
MVKATSEVFGQSGLAIPAVEMKARKKFWLFAWLAFLPFVLIRAENLAESDTFWQIRTGLLTIARGRLPTVDPFSWTAGGEPWTLNSWGFNVAMGAAYQVAGLVGVALVCACLVSVVGGLVLLLARRLGASPKVSAWLLLMAVPLLTGWLSARPQLVDYVAVLVLVMLLHRIVEGHPPAWPLLAIGALTILWANLHVGVLLGVAVAGATALLVLVRRSTRRSTGWCLAALFTTAVCSLFNPYGAGVLAQTLQVKSASTVITEWQAFNPGDPMQILMFALGLIGLGASARRGDPVFTAAIAVAAGGSVVAIRILPILVLLALPVLASFASHPVILRYFASRRVMLAQGASVVVAIAVGVSVFNLPLMGRPDPSHFPGAAIDAIPWGCKLFNEYQLGGLVILERPDVRVSLDSRNDLYGAERVTQALLVLDGHGDLEEGLSGADCVLVPPTSALARRLHASPNWELTSAETTAELFVRR